MLEEEGVSVRGHHTHALTIPPLVISAAVASLSFVLFAQSSIHNTSTTIRDLATQDQGSLSKDMDKDLDLDVDKEGGLSGTMNNSRIFRRDISISGDSCNTLIKDFGTSAIFDILLACSGGDNDRYDTNSNKHVVLKNNIVNVRLRSKYHIINKDSKTESGNFISESPPENDLDLIPKFAGLELSEENKRQFKEVADEAQKVKVKIKVKLKSKSSSSSITQKEEEEKENKEKKKVDYDSLSRESTKDYIRSNNERVHYIDD